MNPGRTLLRLSWRLAQRLGMSPVAEIVYGGRYSIEAPDTRVDSRRGENVLTFLASEGLVRRGLLHWPRPASEPVERAYDLRLADAP